MFHSDSIHQLVPYWFQIWSGDSRQPGNLSTRGRYPSIYRSICGRWSTSAAIVCRLQFKSHILHPRTIHSEWFKLWSAPEHQFHSVDANSDKLFPSKRESVIIFDGGRGEFPSSIRGVIEELLLRSPFQQREVLVAFQSPISSSRRTSPLESSTLDLSCRSPLSEEQIQGIDSHWCNEHLYYWSTAEFDSSKAFEQSTEKNLLLNRSTANEQRNRSSMSNQESASHFSLRIFLGDSLCRSSSTLRVRSLLDRWRLSAFLSIFSHSLCPESLALRLTDTSSACSVCLVSAWSDLHRSSEWLDRCSIVEVAFFVLLRFSTALHRCSHTVVQCFRGDANLFRSEQISSSTDHQFHGTIRGDRLLEISLSDPSFRSWSAAEWSDESLATGNRIRHLSQDASGNRTVHGTHLSEECPGEEDQLHSDHDRFRSTRSIASETALGLRHQTEWKHLDFDGLARCHAFAPHYSVESSHLDRSLLLLLLLVGSASNTIETSAKQLDEHISYHSRHSTDWPRICKSDCTWRNGCIQSWSEL